MRFTPPVLALSLAALLTASAGHSAPPMTLDPRAGELLSQGREALTAGRIDAAVDAFEAALTVQPGSAAILVELAQATRSQGMQGKALHYYREALQIDPQNLSAIAGEGAALAEKGAVDKARRSLTRLEGMCGGDCPATRDLAAAIAKGPSPRVVSAESAVPPKLPLKPALKSATDAN